MSDAAPDFVEVNKSLWNAKTAYHMQSAFYDLPGFRDGASSLNELELNLLGEVRGQRVLHLQCHFGLDTLSLSRLGAHATGVDLSDVAIGQARQLAHELSLDAQFICSNVYDLPQQLPDVQFDIVFASYGVLGWLPDLAAWAQLVARYLRPGGRLVLLEFHPVVWMFDNDFTTIQYSYFNQGIIEEEEAGTYADRTAPITTKSMTWNHSLSEVLGSLLAAGLTIRQFDEYDYSPYDCFAHTEQIAERCYRIKPMGSKLPLVYSLVATR